MLLDVPTLAVPGLIAIFAALAMVALVSGLWGSVRAEAGPVRFAVTLLFSYLGIGFYTAMRPFWVLLLFVLLLVALLETHQYLRLSLHIPPAEGGHRALLTSLVRMGFLLSLVFGVSWLLAGVAAVTHLGSTDIVSGFALGVAVLVIASILALVGRGRPRPA